MSKNIYHVCGASYLYNEEYDAYYCEYCDVWVEDGCGDDECTFCHSRPEKPSQVKSEK